MALTPGTKLGPYEILSPLGAGGMGEVYRARDTRLDREVAVKVLPDEVAAHPDRMARFEREAKTVAALNHPNIVTLHSIEFEGGVRFLTMELVEGQTLDRVALPGGLPLPRVLDLAIPLSDALVAAHERGVVHRDLKPGNVMVTRQGRIKVLDFGLAKLGSSESSPDVTQTMTLESPISGVGQVLGTVPYMSPEQVRGDVVDARTDLFSFGILLYELLGGRRPFGGETSADVSSAILRDAPVPVQNLRSDLPADMGRIVGRCLEKDPERRFQTAKDVRNELELVRRQLDSGSSAVSRGPVVSGIAASATSVPAAGKEVPSIAVLPFVNRSRDEEDEYFADGVADELLSVLAKVRGLRVAARTSSYQFKGKNEELSVIGQKLGVATLLEGTLRKAGNRVRISVQLVKVSDGFHLWSETYDRTLDDIFAVQDDIAQAVVKELRAALLGEEADSKASGDARLDVAQAARGRGTDAEAHRLYLQGRYLVNRRGAEESRAGIAHLRQAVERDPGHALAWAALSWAETFAAITGDGGLEAGIARARDAAERALALEPDLTEGLLARGGVQFWYDFELSKAQETFDNALRSAPFHPEVLQAAAMLAMMRGRKDEALALARRAVEVDPLDVSALMCLGRALRSFDRPEDAEREFLRALEISPSAVAIRLLLAEVMASQGKLDLALKVAEEEPANWARLCALAIVHAKAGRMEESKRALEELIEKRSGDAAYQVAMAYGARAEKEKVFEWLERALAQRDSGVLFSGSEIRFRQYHSDSRWRPLMKRIGLVS